MRLADIPAIQLSDEFCLRKLLISDSISLFPTLNDQENHRFTLFEPHICADETAHWIEKALENPIWAIAAQDNTAIGFFMYHSMSIETSNSWIGFHLNKEYWGKGLVPSAVLLTDDYMFRNTELTSIAATVKPENKQSQRCLEKAGYNMERIIDDYVSSAVNDHSRIRLFYSKQRHETSDG